MCGILAIIGSSESLEALRLKALILSKMIRHRGPDWNGIYMQENGNTTTAMCHERLAIVDPNSGKQPLFTNDKSLCVVNNGEIYNHMALRKLLDPEIVKAFPSQSDCQVLPEMYVQFGADMVHHLDGCYAFVITDKKGNYFAARDPMGICPMYIGWGSDGAVWFSSEMKALAQHCCRFQIFPPGHRMESKNGVMGKIERWYEPVWWNEEHLPSGKLDLARLRTSFEASVCKRLMADVPYGVLLSGGLDSSLVAAIANKEVKSARKDDACVFPKLHSFSVGLAGSPDLIAARKVADFLHTSHHEFTFEIDEGIDALSDVIYHLETYDVTTIRASTPMYFLSRRIKSLGVKMVLSGEGADEIFGGYLYFHKAPNKEEFHKETIRKLKALHQYDVLRANKSTMSWGVEARVPFLDKDFMDIAMSLDPAEKMIRKGERIEKWCIREAFAGAGYLPDEILWRQKEQFSDGVGYGWIDGLKEHAECTITQKMMDNAPFCFPQNTPRTKEAYLYRSIFANHYPQQCSLETVPMGESIACSTPAAIAWDASFAKNADASGRALIGVHTDSKRFAGADAAERIAKCSKIA
eukprot:GEMP01015136.1.p1 GENE.GEMP01015136.1~~GEMP01015136.1.p1  ORF type:complete len:581 (+),score=152.62 GEMP01015136.1:58-1800(+)